MTKVLIFIGKIVLRILEWIMIFLILFAFAIRASRVQTFIAQTATNYLSTKLDRNVSIGRVDVVFFNKLFLDDVYVDDVNRDTLARLDHVEVSLNYLFLKAKRVGIGHVQLKDGHIHLKKDSTTHQFNFQYLVDFFSSDKPKKETKPFKINVSKIDIVRVHFSLDNEKYERTKFGVDYNHLNVKNLYLSAEKTSINGSTIESTIKHLSFHEHSGFKLSKLAGKVGLNPKGLYFDKTRLITDKTSLKIPKLHFVMNGLGQFSHFIDSVKFDAVLNYSQVNLKDVSYFATPLQGMDETIHLEAEVKDYVYNLKLNQLKLDIREKTTLQGNLVLPDFRKLEDEIIQEDISYSYIDLKEIQGIKLPSKTTEKPLVLNELINRFEFIEANNIAAKGKLKNLIFRVPKVKTGIGTIKIDQGIQLIKRNETTYAFQLQNTENRPINIEQFDLGRLLAMNNLGIVDGQVSLDGTFSTTGKIALQNINGDINEFGFNNYSYSKINLKDVSYINNVVDGNIKINDPNLQLQLNGEIDLNKLQSYKARIVIDKAFLNRLNLVKSDSVLFVKGIITADISGADLYSYTGDVCIDSLQFINGRKKLFLRESSLILSNNSQGNSIILSSDVIDANIAGVINYKTISTELTNTLALSFPTLIKAKPTKRTDKKSQFDYLFKVKNLNPVLALFVDNVSISKGTTIQGKYTANENDLSLIVNSPVFKYGTVKVDSITLTNNFTVNGFDAKYHINRLLMNDSIHFDNVNILANGNSLDLNMELNWELDTPKSSEIKWNTQINSFNDIVLDIQKSYFTVNSNRWEIANETHFEYSDKRIEINNFNLTHEDQYLKINGLLSANPEDKIHVKAKSLNLEDFSSFIPGKLSIKGRADGDFVISDVFNAINVGGDLKITDLVLNNSEVGTIDLSGLWDNQKKAINVNGSLLYRNNKTFTVYGDYYVARKTDNLDFKLKFDQTNIAFLNAFLDPKVISNLRGLLHGELDVKGELSKPDITGSIDLKQGNIKVAMFGVNYGFNGKVKVTKDIIQIDYMPLIDEDGNKGFLNGAIVHENFSNFNFDVYVGLDDIKNLEGGKGSFLAMNTVYEEGQIYYGKAYVSGWVSVSGYLDNIYIDVNVKTQKNTTVVIPLYGPEEISDELSYTIIKYDTIDSNFINNQFDMTGINLNLNFDVTPDALIKLVFDDQTGDEISANGQGQISIKLNSSNDLSMDGNFVITKGSYNFVFNPIKKEFKVEPGSSISWKGGSPTDADLNITAIYNVNTDLSIIAPELESKRSSSTMQNVAAKIYLVGNLNSPQLSFEIKAPKASESARAAVDRINSDQDELNRQFFMLLLTGRFQGNGAGAGAYGSNAALEALTGQINNLLDAVSKDVRLNVDLRNDQVTGQNSQAIGFETNLLNDKLVVKGNFGVQNKSGGTKNSTLIGDLNLEYIIDDAGNLRVSIFNESNSYSVMQDKNLGPFTQGIGLVYSESFSRVKEMKILNFIADIFRKDKFFKFTKHRRQKLLPELRNTNEPEEDPTETKLIQQQGVIEEEED